METLLSLALAALSLVFPSYGTQGIQQLQFWKTSGGNVQLSSTTASIRVPFLASLGCIGTDANGVFGAGSCSGVGGSGTVTWDVVGGTLFMKPTTTLGIIVNASSTFNGTTTIANGLQVGGTAIGSTVARFSKPTNFDPSNSESVGGIVGIDLGSNDEMALRIYGDHSGSSRAVSIINNNTGYTGNLLHLRNEGTNTSVNIGCHNIQGLGCIKARLGPGADLDSSLFSGQIDSLTAQGIFLLAHPGNTGKLLNLRVASTTEALTMLGSTGFLGLSTTSPYAALSVAHHSGIVTSKIHATSTTQPSTLIYASSTAFSTTVASSTFWHGGGLLSTCAAGSFLTWTGGQFGCDTDDNTTYTAGDHLTLTGNDFDVDDDFLLNTGDTGIGLYTFDNSSTTRASFSYASSTLYHGAGLANCNTGNMLTWTDGRFGCEDDTAGSGGTGSNFLVANGTGWLYPSTTIGLIVNASSTIGNGSQQGGLTVTGNATTSITGSATIPSRLVIFNTGTQAGQESRIELGGYQGGINNIITSVLNAGGSTSNLLFKYGNGAPSTALTISGTDGLLTFGSASSTLISASYASSTKWTGGGLGADCDADNQALEWDATLLQFTCGDDDNSGGSAGVSDWAVFGGTAWMSPQYSWDSDSNLGLYRVAEDTLGFTAGGFTPLTLRTTGASTTNFSANCAAFGTTATTTLFGNGDATIGDDLTVTDDLFLDGGTARILLGSDGIDFQQNGAGALTLASLGATNNEDITVDLETTADAAVWSSTTGVANIDWSAIALSTFTNSSTTRASFAYASSTKWIGGGLGSDCDGDGQTLGWDVTLMQFTCGDDDGGAGSSPGGSDTQLQFNDGGSFAGASLYWDKTKELFGVGSTSPWASLSVASSTYDYLRPLFAVSGNSTLLMTIQSTTTLLSPGGGTTFLRTADQGARLGLGIPSSQFPSVLDHFEVLGRINQRGWEEYTCLMNYGDLPLSADTRNACRDWSFQEDNTATLTNTSIDTSGTRGINIELSGGVANNGAMLYIGPVGGINLRFGNANLVYEAYGGISTTQNATNTNYFLGTVNTAPNSTTYETNPTNGCYFAATTTELNWWAVCRNASATTQIDTGFASSTVASGNSAPYLFRIEMGNGTARFYMASSTQPLRRVATIINNVPTTNDSAPTLMLSNVTAGTGSRGFLLTSLRAWLRVY